MMEADVVVAVEALVAAVEGAVPVDAETESDGDTEDEDPEVLALYPSDRIASLPLEQRWGAILDWYSVRRRLDI